MNKAMEYGSVVANAIENGEETGDLLTDAAIALLPKYDIRDKDMYGELKTRYGWLKILSHPDTMDSKTLALREYKTGMVKWTQRKADKWFQLKFYAMLIYICYGKLPPTVHLDWIQTEKVLVEDPFLGEIEIIRPTGHVETFEVKITLQDVLETMNAVTKAAHEIEIAWASHIPEPDKPF
jgi:hypothetical protein